ncbi:Unknown protein sequence [Pseudomonas syringae pv. syringae]|uniref:Uncharacterized protein n=1 Tax=Pseudomonas syringae pv. solidagae TaxID=264458 RepID=A0A3M5LD93_PSESX|nr:Unknown protein sequence [Pseudomonas syringae pv. aceris]KPB29730.1 Unknown protein sequence [Pseudomonas syringae pv. syringae]RMS20883.1 hypothetical protein ALP69_101581 [Pseudomonas syringae pv. aceris]RMS60605.1 hypothetical protein ALP63_101952 [Pseudomonas syringae pv. aceris]RMT46069.1 hypothetical protein ALP48_102092 [Pseudomonas syringae pv. solidagae]
MTFLRYFLNDPDIRQVQAFTPIILPPAQYESVWWRVGKRRR